MPANASVDANNLLFRQRHTKKGIDSSVSKCKFRNHAPNILPILAVKWKINIKSFVFCTFLSKQSVLYLELDFSGYFH